MSFFCIIIHRNRKTPLHTKPDAAASLNSKQHHNTNPASNILRPARRQESGPKLVERAKNAQTSPRPNNPTTNATTIPKPTSNYTYKTNYKATTLHLLPTTRKPKRPTNGHFHEMHPWTFYSEPPPKQLTRQHPHNNNPYQLGKIQCPGGTNSQHPTIALFQQTLTIRQIQPQQIYTNGKAPTKLALQNKPIRTIHNFFKQITHVANPNFIKSPHKISHENISACTHSV